MKKKIKKLPVILTFFLLAGFYCKGSQTANTEQASPMEISFDNFLSTYKSDKNIKVLDVRESGEYAAGHVPGAKLAPLSQLKSPSADPENLIPYAKGDNIYVICRSGKRSMAATQIMRGLGYTNAVSVQGGTLAYINSGNEVEK
ncbi:MAG: rhodanese-like domain-containing protein [Spirochaetia bacterium]|nr:rhodanese-like domain-containing protein [Spirochaetia bacterium]